MKNNHIQLMIEVPISSINDIFRIFDVSEKYIFRGQPGYEWDLSTTFERAIRDIDPMGWQTLEEKLILEFQRKAHHYISDLPHSELEWLALMRHYGSPTRLIDLTRSFLVALFFAVENAESDSAVWAIDTSYFVKRPEPASNDYLLSTYCKEAEDEVNQIFRQKRNPESGIIFVEPFRQNERLAIQKGVFAFPKNIQASFMKNLTDHLKLFKPDQEAEAPWVIQKIKIPQRYHIEIITILDKMNINRATLFPGLDGFAKSQINHIKAALHHEKILGDKLKEVMESMVPPYSSESSEEHDDKSG